MNGAGDCAVPLQPSPKMLQHPGHPAPPLHTSLPTLGFDASLRLVYINDKALEVFFGGEAAVPAFEELEAAWFMGEPHAERLGMLADESRGSWGEAPVVEFWKGATAEEGMRTSFYAEVLVEALTPSAESDLAFSIFLLRPAALMRPQVTRTESASFTLAPPSNVIKHQPALKSQSRTAHLQPALSRWQDEEVHLTPNELYDTLKVVTARVTATPRGPTPTDVAVGDRSPTPSLALDATPTAPEDVGMAGSAGDPSGTLLQSSVGTTEEEEDGLGDKGQKVLTLDDLHRLMDTLPMIVFTSEATGQVDWFNKEWYRYTGLGHVESMDFANWADMFHPDDLVTALPIWVNSMATGDSFRFEYRVKGADGNLRWSVCSGRSKKDREGTILSWACAITDIDELVQARQHSLQVKEHISAVLSGADLVLLSVDRENVVTFFEGSAAASRCLGQVNAEGGIPTVGSRVVWPDSRLQNAVDAILSEEQPNVELLLDGTDSHGYPTFCRYRLVPLRSGALTVPKVVTGVIIVCNDITELHLAEAALRRAHQEKAELSASEMAAKEASRLKTAFLTTISHEIRTPIAGVLGILELLDSDPSLAEGHRSLVAKAIRSGELLLDLVGMVLDVRKIEAGELHLEETPFELHQVIADAQLFSVSAFRNGVSFVEDVRPYYQLALLGDPLRLRQVFANALSNSVKFTKSGSITLRVRQEEESETGVVILFEVADTGVGIHEDILPTLFQPFRQADASTARNYGGSGLGLVIAKNLVEMMGGSIVLSSVYGQGTTMTFRVPFKKAPTGRLSLGQNNCSSPELNPSSGRPSRQSIKVLLAEDNELIREIITRLLRKMEFQVDAVEDGAAAVAAATASRYDVILMDGQMPGTDGYEATAQLRRSADPTVRSIRIIALTASAIEGDRERCIAAGMDAYLAKPVRARDLEAAIWKQLERP